MSTSKATELSPPSMSDQPPSFEESISADPLIFKTQFACMTLNMNDRIRLINFTQVEVEAVKQVVKTRWKPGLVQTRPYGESTEVWVRGRPWANDSNGNDDARRLILWILETLFDLGWVMQCSLDITRKSDSKDTLIFRKQDPTPPPCDWICISFDNSDKLKIVDSPPKDLTDAILQTFGRDVRRREITAEKFKIHLGIQPWEPSGTDTVTTRLLLLRLVETLESGFVGLSKGEGLGSWGANLA
ncbi:hypothetical protein FLAG1_08577 [Fusarium langsethiae]|uniref:Uncharacterized protein n=1 Tax=Fusarium langsethiae TaxID=179993 RepID=A0A0N0DCQ9_FUSLA|nr:hypothetical protein FLAG1_08577 [Fusarium langsethiae]GKU05674.1 unnamed protein product [Fusarium langsethiae]GKU21551.1 unnamed protein product [Fusarium langsethiae]